MSFIPCPKSSSCIYCQNKSSYPYDYSFVESAFCINLSERKDKFKQACKQFHKVGLCQIVEFFVTDRLTNKQIKQQHKCDPLKIDKGTVGCYDSHRKVIKKALKRGSNNCLVFEDDVYFARPSSIHKYIYRYNKLPKDWDIYYMGHFPRVGYPIYDGLYRTFSTDAHAYMMNHNAMKKLAKTPYGKWGLNCGIDIYHMLKCKCYTVYPMSAHQKNTDSDTTGQKLDPSCRDGMNKIERCSLHLPIIFFLILTVSIITLSGLYFLV